MSEDVSVDAGCNLCQAVAGKVLRGIVGALRVELKGVESAAGGDGACDCVGEGARAGAGLDDDRAWGEEEVGHHVGNVWGVQNLRPVGERQRPQVGRRPEEDDVLPPLPTLLHTRPKRNPNHVGMVVQPSLVVQLPVLFQHHKVQQLASCKRNHNVAIRCHFFRRPVVVHCAC